MPSANMDDYYTVVLSNPDYTLFGPVIYQMVGNVKGRDIKYGDFNNEYWNNDEVECSSIEIIPFTAPSPPISYINYHYSYLVYKQTGGVVDYSQASTVTSSWQ